MPHEFRQNERLWRIALVLCMGSLAGCGGPSGPQRIPLEGTVTRAGKLMEQGAITLTPASGHSGVAANGTIEKGRYKFTRETGPNPGPHLVQVQEFLPKEELMKRKLSPTTPPTHWQMEVDVPESGSLVRDLKFD